MSRRALPVPLILAVLIVPILWLLGVVDDQGIERHPFDYGMQSVRLRQAGITVAIGFVAGLLAAVGAPRAWVVRGVFTLMVLAAGLSSWGVLFVVVALNSTSGHGIHPDWVTGTVGSWLLAFAAFFGTAWLVRWGSAHNSGSSRLRRTA